jgi:serine/threonine-protein kinase
VKATRRVRVPGYEVVDVLGTGAMATVYRAVQTTLQRQVALKVLHDGVARDPDYRERFLREARAAAKLSHGNVVRAYEAGVHEGTYWFAMELVEGEDLGERLGWAHTLPEAEALDVAIQVARALAAAQEHGLVHRDVKPENILIGEDGTVKLADLGLAKVQGDGSITAEGVTVGTVAFLSPEQCTGAPDLDIRSDLWALGGLLFVMLSGELPYGRGENAVVTMKRIVKEDPPRLDAKAASPATLDLVRRLMTRARDDRPASAAAALALLEAARARLRDPDGAAADDEESTTGTNASGRRTTRRSRRRGGSASTYAGLRGRGGPASSALLAPLAVALGVGVAVAFALSRGAGSPSPAVVVAPPPRRPAPAVTPAPAPPPAEPARPIVVVPSRVDSADAPVVATEASPPTTTPPRATTPEEPAPALEPTPTLASATDVERLRAASRASSVEALEGGRVRLSWTFDDPAQLEGWSRSGDGDADIASGALRVAARARGKVTLELGVPLREPIEVRYRMRVTTPSFGRNGVVATRFGPRLASFAGAALYSIDADDEGVQLAGSRLPQSVIGGTRRAVRLTLDEGVATGWVDERERYRHPVEVPQPLRLSLRVAGGVAIDLRDLVIEGVPDPAWLEEGR